MRVGSYSAMAPVSDRRLSKRKKNMGKGGKLVYNEVENRLWKWFKKCRAENVYVSGRMAMKRAKSIAVSIGHYDFEPDVKWVDDFKAKHDIFLSIILTKKVSNCHLIRFFVKVVAYEKSDLRITCCER